MRVQPANTYSNQSFPANSPKQRQTAASGIAIAAASATTTISQAARNSAKGESMGSGAYDFTNMSPNQMRDVAQELFDAGKIGSQQHLMLLTTSFVGRFPATREYTPPTDADIARHNNTPMNYVQYCKDRISFLESSGLTSDPQHGYEGWKGLLATLQGMTSGSVA